MSQGIDICYNYAGESPATVSHNQDRCEALPIEKGALIDIYPEDYWCATHISIYEVHIFDIVKVTEDDDFNGNFEKMTNS